MGLLLQIDALTWIRNAADKSVDHVITDYEYETVFPYEELLRICKGTILTFCAAGERPFDDNKVERAYWIKTPSTKNNKASRKLSRYVEEIHILRRDEYDVFNTELHWSNYTGVYTDMVETKGFYWKKPLSLMERLVAIYTQPGDVVLDPFCGSGTTLQSCINLDREWIGLDHNEERIAECRKSLRYYRVDWTK